jgi:hypothetical protein
MRQQETPQTETECKEKSQRWVGMIGQKGDILAGRLDQCTSHIQGVAQTMHKHSQGGGSEIANPYSDI